jgi:malonyl-CoA O-methyltransferase
MFSFYKKTISLQEALEGAKRWIADNTIDGGIAHSSQIRKPYPEVTGYYIPTLLKWGEIDRAKYYADWLLSIQTPEGAWQNTDLNTIYTFDTGQILKGLYELIPYDKKYEEAFLKGCDWFLKQIDKEGRIHTPTQEAFSSIGSEYIHLYTLEPLKLAAEKYHRKDYASAVIRAENYYLNLPDLTEFKIITHFHAYVVEALIDLGYKEKALEALKSLRKYELSNGFIPAFPNVRWVCLTAMLQYAVCYYKLGMLDEGDKLLFHAVSKQNKSGGFFGGYGWFVTYFKNIEISWPVKYLLDALYLRKELQKRDGSSIQNGLKDCDEQYAASCLSPHKDSLTRQYKLDVVET